MCRWLLCFGLLVAAPLGAQETPAAPALAPPSEKEWRGRFEELHSSLETVRACRARLDDYCSWEYYKSREDSEVQSYKAYLDAKRRGEDVKDPLKGKVYVPEECERLFETYPDEIRLVVDPDKPESCLTRVHALIAGIDRVAAFWEERESHLEREARDQNVPSEWRSPTDR